MIECQEKEELSAVRVIEISAEYMVDWIIEPNICCTVHLVIEMEVWDSNIQTIYL